ncbi:phosphonate ABC transporter, permease protein PhnE [Algihabitans sp.]|uniref:phosphonate ABC transporter, permease protein PhnE n=1 Tax=Algihabitans sp. TaxID=2821514 RepID=UPI003BA9D830
MSSIAGQQTVSTGAQRLDEMKVELPKRDPKKSLLTLLIWGVTIAILWWAWNGSDMNPYALIEYSGNMAEFAGAFAEPDFRHWRLFLDQMLITVQIAIWGTLLAVIFGVPLGILSSENLVPWWVYHPVRRVMDAFRAINEMVFAMLFVVAVGLGPFAGVLALFVHTTGVLAKLFSEAVEAIDPRPVEGIRATGAHPVQEIVFGVIPQVLPLWISYSLYRFESNVRSATVLGLVGAGGIGQVLWEYIRGFYYSETAAVMLIIILTVTILDIGSQYIRKRYT